MDLKEIEKHARALMTLHGVGSLNFKFDNGKKRIGCTMFRRCPTPDGRSIWVPFEISLSRHFAVLLTMDEIRDTILHEIAHALAGHDARHGPIWQREARALGIKAQACKTTSAKPEASVKGVCTNPDCGKLVSSLHRLPLRVYFHRNCGVRYPLQWSKNGRVLSVEEMPQRYRAEYARKFAHQVA